MRSRTASSNWKIAVLAPMPSASDTIGGHGKALVAHQQPHRESKVLPERVDGADRVHPVDLLAHPGGVAELPDRGVVRRLRRHAARDVVVGFDGDVGRDLARRIVVSPPTPEEFRERIICV